MKLAFEVNLHILSNRRDHPATARADARGGRLKAAVVDAVGAGFTIAEVELAYPLGREVLIDVRASGLCHTDLTIATQDMGVFPMPVLCGHEVAGVVLEAGPQATQFQAGDRVAACLVQSCGTCAVCLAGRPFQCPNGATLMRTASQAPRVSRGGEAVTQAFGLGGFAAQALIHENQLVQIPVEMPFPQAALLGCGVVTGAGAVLNAARVRPGDTVAIIGAGGVGLNAVTAASLAGAAQIIAVDIHDATLQKALRFGATDVINSATVNPVEAVRELLPGGVDSVFDFVGLNEVSARALEMLTVGGALYLIGVSGPDSQVTVNLVDAVLRQPRVVGVNTGSTNFKRDIPLYSRMYLDGRLELDALVSAEISLDQIESGYQKLADPEVSRVVITRF
jgi:S-(hydroxymethyl)glutathione dehydrogenase / alcohol dehydrogenase